MDTSALRNSEAYLANAFKREYLELYNNWDVQAAYEMLKSKRDLPKKAQKGLPVPRFAQDGQWLLLMLLHDAYFSTDGAYWNGIMQAMGTPALQKLNDMDLKSVGETKFIDNLQWCYEQVQNIGESWLTDELKLCLETDAPQLWRGIHSGIFSSGIKKLVKDGWNGLHKDFANWLKH